MRCNSPPTGYCRFIQALQQQSNDGLIFYGNLCKRSFQQSQQVISVVMKSPLYRIFLIFVLLALPLQTWAVPRIDITQASSKTLPIALTNFEVATPDLQKASEGIYDVIDTNLTNAGRFRIIPRKGFLEDIAGIETVPKFENWQTIGADSLLMASVTADGSDGLRIAYRLWDTVSGRQVINRSYNAKRNNWRRVAHLISDDIYARLTGEGGHFDSRIVYVAEDDVRGQKYRRKRLAIMDQDGANHQYLSSGKHMVFTPRFDPVSQRIIYLAFYNDTPQVYLYHITTGKEEVLGEFDGMSFAPRFSGDGKKVVLSASKNGNSDIYVMDINSRRTKQITDHYAIDTSPSFSPNGKQIVFNSDRGGSQQLYVMDADGDNVKRISFGKGSYATPVWSPKGDLIAFTKMHKGTFHIGVMRPDGGGERLLTKAYLVEGPTWSPNGQILMYTKQNRGNSKRMGTTALYAIDAVTGKNERRITTPVQASDPAWSPLLSK